MSVKAEPKENDEHEHSLQDQDLNEQEELDFDAASFYEGDDPDREVTSMSLQVKLKKLKKKNWKLHYINPKGKFILSPQEQHQGPRFKVSSDGLSTEIDILIRSPIQVLTEAAVA